MLPWIGGIVIGLLLGLATAGVASTLLYRRNVALGERARAAERLAELGTLTAGLAHEIKNPLSTVQLNLQLLQEDLQQTGCSPRVTTRLTTVTREATRLRDILDSFLRYAGRIELQRERVNLDLLLEELVDFLAPQAQLGRVRLRHIPAAEPVVADADPRLIKQAALNLMLNALQAMPGGGELIVDAGREDGAVTLSVTDTGPGIALEEQGRIFQAYVTRKKGGTGLGLPMTQRIAREHGGAVELQSEVGKGSRFTIKLPAAKP
ncbi:MAG TPA: ATP-binding protein [Tepidisphaeraceae bacterium]|jgi:signal transduction histidine kinase